VLWEKNIAPQNSGPFELRSHFIEKRKKKSKKRGGEEKKGMKLKEKSEKIGKRE